MSSQSPAGQRRSEHTGTEQSRSEQKEADQHSAKQPGREQSRAHWGGAGQSCLAILALGLPYSHAVFIALLCHNWTLLNWIKFPFSPYLKLGITVGIELVSTTIGWHTEHGGKEDCVGWEGKGTERENFFSAHRTYKGATYHLEQTELLRKSCVLRVVIVIVQGYIVKCPEYIRSSPSFLIWIKNKKNIQVPTYQLRVLV